MKALTIWQPWASCIACGPKRVENRSWQWPASWRVPFDLAIHAAAKRRSREDEEDDLSDIELEWPFVRNVPLDRGCVVAVASVVGSFPHHRDSLFLRHGDDPWAVGPVCWQLDNVRALINPVPCRGAQGLWTLPPEAEALVMEQLPRTRERGDDA